MSDATCVAGATPTPPPPRRPFPHVDATFSNTPLQVFPAGPGAWRVVSDFDPARSHTVAVDGTGRYRCTCDLAWTTGRGRQVPCHHAAAVIDQTGTTTRTGTAGSSKSSSAARRTAVPTGAAAQLRPGKRPRGYDATSSAPSKPASPSLTAPAPYRRGWITYWFTEIRPNEVSSETLNRDAYLARLHLYPALGSRCLKDLQPEHVEKVLKAKAAAGYARATVDRIKCVLRMGLAEAERRGEVSRNVATLVRTPKGAQKEGRTLTVEQARSLLDALEGHARQALWLAVLLLGLRPGEVCRLTWDDIDFDREHLHVRRHRRGTGADMHLGVPKTAKSRRSLDMPAPLVEALRRHRADQARLRLVAAEGWQDLGLVFPTESGRFIDG